MAKTWHFPQSTSADPPRTKESRTVAWVYAGVLFIMAVIQLATISTFLQTLHNQYGWSYAQSGWGTGIIIFIELLALPFLLRWRLSIGLRAFSMASSWLAALAWIKMSITALLKSGVGTIPFLGGVSLVAGWWALFMSVALAILAVWASWGLWPFVQQLTHKKKR